MGIENDLSDFFPPPGVPPLLSNDQIVFLATQGHLLLPLSPGLAANYENLSKVVAKFFSQPDDEKSTLYPTPGGPELGYFHIPGEKEYLTLNSARHPDTELETSVKQVWDETGALLQRVMVDLARGLGLPAGVWDELLDGCLDLPATSLKATPTILRLFQYSPNSGVLERHTDIGLLTLCIPQGEGLQVWDQTGKLWSDVEGPTLLIGDALRSLVGNRLRAGVHRVVANSAGRSSAIFALRPSLRHEIDLRIFGGGISADVKGFWAHYKQSRYNVNAPKDIRERQIQQMKARSNQKKRI